VPLFRDPGGSGVHLIPASPQPLFGEILRLEGHWVQPLDSLSKAVTANVRRLMDVEVCAPIEELHRQLFGLEKEVRSIVVQKEAVLVFEEKLAWARLRAQAVH